MNYARSTAVVVEACCTPDGRGSAGSGFVLRRSGPYAIVATNRHVVLDDSGTPLSGFRVRTAAGSERNAALLFVEPRTNMDFALLAVRDEQHDLGQDVRIADRAEEGGYVVCVGSPLESPLTTFDGRLTWVSDGMDRFAADCVGERGSSGGPVFDANNSVVGIIAVGMRSPSTGVEEMGGYLLGRYVRRLSVHETSVAAKGDWQDSRIAVKRGDHVEILASGAWFCGPACGFVSAAGTSARYAAHAYDPRFPHAALLVRVSGSEETKCICKAGSGGVDDVLRTEVFITSFAADRRGTLEFRPNDRQYQDNMGQLHVLVVVKRRGS